MPGPNTVTVLKCPAYACAECLELMDTKYDTAVKIVTIKHRKTKDCRFSEQSITIPFSDVTVNLT